LAGFKYREVAPRLRAFGFVFDREGPGSHEVRRQIETVRTVTLPRHARDTAEGTLRAILREAGIHVEDFLKARPHALYGGSLFASTSKRVEVGLLEA